MNSICPNCGAKINVEKGSFCQKCAGILKEIEEESIKAKPYGGFWSRKKESTGLLHLGYLFLILIIIAGVLIHFKVLKPDLWLFFAILMLIILLFLSFSNYGRLKKDSDDENV